MLAQTVASELQERGFVVIPGPYRLEAIEQLADAYDIAVRDADAEDVKIGSTSTRVTDFVNRGDQFDALYIFPPLLGACELIIGQPFKLSSLHARSVRSKAPAQDLHVDVPRDSADYPLLAFILMVDEFRPDNGATRFIPGSQLWPEPADAGSRNTRANEFETVLATGGAGSLILFNGSVWHGHSANRSSNDRRSLQGAFIPRSGRSGTDFERRMRPATRARIGPFALEILGSGLV